MKATHATRDVQTPTPDPSCTSTTERLYTCVQIETSIFLGMTTAVSRSMLLLSWLALSSSWTLCRTAHVPVSRSMRSFSYAIKGGYLDPGKEYPLYESNTGEPGVITEQWYTGEHQ